MPKVLFFEMFPGNFKYFLHSFYSEDLLLLEPCLDIV